MMKQLFSLLGTVMIAAASVPFTAAAEAEPENYERKGKSPDDLYDCIVWNESSIGEVTFDGDETEGGGFNCQWDQVQNCIFSKGHNLYEQEKTYKDYGDIECEYALDYSADGISKFGVHGWLKDPGSGYVRYPMTEYYIIDGYNEWRPGSDAESVGQIVDNGVTYDLYCLLHDTPAFAPDATFLRQYFSVATDTDNLVKEDGTASVSRIIDIGKHFRAWQKAGMDMDLQLQNVEFIVEGWKCSGTASVTKNEITINEKPASDYYAKGMTPDGYYDYEVWSHASVGTVSFDGAKKDGGVFACSWNDAGNCIFSKGHHLDARKFYTDFHDISCDYTMDYTADGDSYFGIHGWAKDCQGKYPLVEYFIVDGFSGQNPLADAEPIGSFVSDGRNYNLYRVVCEDAPSILGEQTFYQYWSIADTDAIPANEKASYEQHIDIDNHFDAWNEAGMQFDGFLYEVSFQIEARESSGEADLTKNTVRLGFSQGADEPAEPVGSSAVSGDVNNNGKLDIADVVMLQKWLVGAPDASLANWKAADFQSDNQITAVDLTLMKRALLRTAAK